MASFVALIPMIMTEANFVGELSEITKLYHLAFAGLVEGYAAIGEDVVGAEVGMEVAADGVGGWCRRVRL